MKTNRHHIDLLTFLFVASNVFFFVLFNFQLKICSNKINHSVCDLFARLKVKCIVIWENDEPRSLFQFYPLIDSRFDVNTESPRLNTIKHFFVTVRFIWIIHTDYCCRILLFLLLPFELSWFQSQFQCERIEKRNMKSSFIGIVIGITIIIIIIEIVTRILMSDSPMWNELWASFQCAVQSRCYCCTYFKQNIKIHFRSASKTADRDFIHEICRRHRIKFKRENK